jgi:hypothetical protein
MAKTNVATRAPARRTHEGGPALPEFGPRKELRRAISSCLLWEDGFYVDGVSIADRIKDLVAQCPQDYVADLAVEARHQMKLRHAPLWLLATMFTPTRQPTQGLDRKIASVLRRADEPGELLALLAKAWPQLRRTNGADKTLLRVPAAVKRGIAQSMGRHDAYALGKYNRKAAFSLKDVLRLTHPRNPDRAPLWKQLIAGVLPAPDTWEVELSAGKDKKGTFERLLRETKLGYLALIRNLRNMVGAGVDSALVRQALLARKGADMVLPFRYVAAARAAPQYEPELDTALRASLEQLPPFSGDTIVLVDVSGSMGGKLSGKSDLRRIDAAAALASIIPGRCRVFVFDERCREIPPRKGMAGVDAITRELGGWTKLGAAVERVNQEKHDRLIVISDEESADHVGAAAAKWAYMINVAQAEHAVGYGPWVRITGFSENVIRFIADHEALVAEEAAPEQPRGEPVPA